jgi:hypothetical protein
VEAGEAGDQLLDDDGLADAGAAEQARLAATDQRAEQVDDLDAGLEQLGLRGELVELGWLVVDRPPLLGGDRAEAVDHLADQVEHPAEGLDADRHRDRRAGVEDVDAALEAVGRAEGHGADAAAAEVLGDLAPEGVGGRLAEHGARHLDAEGVIDQGQVLFRELRVQRRADDLRHFAVVGVRLNVFHGAFQFS